jgi:hypothetical protein
MSQYALTNYLNAKGPMLGSLLRRLQQLNAWNAWFKQCITSDDKLLTNHCQIVNLVGDTLVILADSPHWITKLRFFTPVLLPKLQANPTLKHIKQIQCKVYPNYKPYISRKKRAPQTKPSKQEQSLAIAKDIKDPTIRETLLRILKPAEDS